MGIPQSQQTAWLALHFVKNAALSFSNWRVVLRTLGMWSPPCKCFVPESDRREVECVVVIMVVRSVVPWLVWGPTVGICAVPPALTVELSKLDMNNGPTIFWRTILQTYDSIAFQR